MPEITTSREIDAPLAHVWAVVSNPHRFADWNTLHQRWAEEPPATLSEGVRVVDVVKIKGIVDTIDFITEDFQDPGFLALSGNGSTGSSVVLEFTVSEQTAERSLVTLHIVFTSSVLFGPLGKVVERAFRKELNDSLEKLAKVVTGG
ncbi:SRPBCC family protein [Mycobacterium sp. ITM-2016-00316]|uniref:type II toxin-antitoxin system Rv0910 family toxin n=1 Tax=Mycobacterium sp. ITM-2016-00316 TaxID=2099695 RepID=UPI000CF9A6FC|nr:SRPBCC family protein [Mycobacterium sp. ITM-2016-00316]WNG81088.1 SRPBCC family protein [Mycobacterium sp. ITM-2016-00316]